MAVDSFCLLFTLCTVKRAMISGNSIWILISLILNFGPDPDPWKPISLLSKLLYLLSRRKPKLFFVSTGSSTSTIITAKTCYMSAASLTTCGRRRKRMVMDSDEALVDQIAADKSITAEDIDEMDLSSGLDEKGNKNNHHSQLC